jgi:hypothetical protein
VPYSEGLYFCVVSLFRIGHQPFLLPWSSIRKVEQTKFWIFRSINVEIEDAAGLATLRLEDDFKVVARKYVRECYHALPG